MPPYLFLNIFPTVQKGQESWLQRQGQGIGKAIVISLLPNPCVSLENHLRFPSNSAVPPSPRTGEKPHGSGTGVWPPKVPGSGLNIRSGKVSPALFPEPLSTTRRSTGTCQNVPSALLSLDPFNETDFASFSYS